MIQPPRSLCSRLTPRALACAATLAASCAAPAAETPAAPDTLDAIVVKSDKLTVDSLIDRKVYRVDTDVQSTFGSLSDILSVIPSVDVDPDGVVALRGDTKVLVLIDGKPTAQLSGSSAGDNLQSIPASDIERIEVITTPPAQFKADGAAGVINIITKKHHRSGTSGSVQASHGQGIRSVLGADARYSKGPLSLSLTTGYREDFRERRLQSSVASSNAAGQPTLSTNSVAERIRRRAPSVTGSGQYVLNDRQTLSGSASFSQRGGLRTYTQNTGDSAGGTMLGSARRLSYGHDPETDHDEKLGLTQSLGKDASLDLSLHHSASHQDEHYAYLNDSVLPPAATSYADLDFRETHGTTDAAADFTRSFSDTRVVKLGYSFERDDFGMRNVGGLVDPVSGAQTLDPLITNEFTYHQNIHAVYGSYQTALGRWNFLTGVRAEQVNTDAEQLTNAISTKTSYVEVYPSVHVTRDLSERSTLSFGASRRVNRPEPSFLDPYVDHEYTPNLTAGNAHLRPQFSQSYETGYGYQGGSRTFSLTGYYRLNKDTTTDLTQYLDDGLTLATKTNLPRDKSAGVEFNAGGKVRSKLSYSLSGNVFYTEFDATALGYAGLRSTTGVNAKAKIDYRPTPDNAAQLTLTRTDKRLTPQGYLSAIDIVNLGYKLKLTSDLTAIATVSDLFNGQRIHRYLTAPGFVQDYQRLTAGRLVYLGVVYAFGFGGKDGSENFDYDPG